MGGIFPVSVILGLGVYQIIPKNRFCNYFVKYGPISLPIYLIHAPVASVVRILLFKIGMNNLFVHIVIGVAFGWFISILLYRIASKLGILDFIFYPAKYLKMRKNNIGRI